ncbi:MAG: hypothetical protein KDA60_01335 [Planctomycetales bacterium]|nr:hypothetical protein [Planctomycetales bacterium]
MSDIEMEPLLSIQLFGHLPAYRPGDMLTCDYQIDAVEEGEVQAVEASVLWFTDGKGDQDMGVHFFERRQASDLSEGDLRELYRFQVQLPNSPLSYDGELVQIQWCVRLRVFLRHGREACLEHPFRLGHPPADDYMTP